MRTSNCTLEQARLAFSSHGWHGIGNVEEAVLQRSLRSRTGLTCSRTSWASRAYRRPRHAELRREGRYHYAAEHAF